MSNEDYYVLTKRAVPPAYQETYKEHSLQETDLNGIDALIWIYSVAPGPGPNVARDNGDEMLDSKRDAELHSVRHQSVEAYERRRDEIDRIIHSFDKMILTGFRLQAAGS